MRTLTLALLLMSTAATALDHHGDDKAEILAVTNKLFDAIPTGRAEDWRAVMLETGLQLSVRANPDDPDGPPLIRSRSNAEALAALNGTANPYLERWLDEPDIQISGALASVWGPYDFWIDGKFSHCGIDELDLVKTADGWKITNIMWTVETSDEACPSKSGPAPQ